MKKQLFYICTTILFFSSIIQPSSGDPTKLFLGSIQFPETLLFDLCLYYKGQKIPTESDDNQASAEFSFLESKYTQELFILISENISCKTSENNTVNHLTNCDKNYKCYHLSAHRVDGPSGKAACSWLMKKHQLHENIIPDNTVIFLFDPKFVEELEVNYWDKNSTMRLLPTIHIKDTISSKELSRAMTVARLKAIDIDGLHTKSTPQKSA